MRLGCLLTILAVYFLNPGEARSNSCSSMGMPEREVFLVMGDQYCISEHPDYPGIIRLSNWLWVAEGKYGLFHYEINIAKRALTRLYWRDGHDPSERSVGPEGFGIQIRMNGKPLHQIATGNWQSIGSSFDGVPIEKLGEMDLVFYRGYSKTYGETDESGFPRVIETWTDTYVSPTFHVKNNEAYDRALREVRKILADRDPMLNSDIHQTPSGWCENLVVAGRRLRLSREEFTWAGAECDGRFNSCTWHYLESDHETMWNDFASTTLALRSCGEGHQAPTDHPYLMRDVGMAVTYMKRTKRPISSDTYIEIFRAPNGKGAIMLYLDLGNRQIRMDFESY